ncbi:MAG: gamma-glutamyl-gamma-aminobutyrate hydrolase family protein [Clostridia bacterium]|nr:gamma-glutamyl-gamma-aminobutyrate hydrolase family protein [Clostridia bacterium]
MPMIAVTPSWDNNTRRMVVNHDYINAVTDAGGIPAVIPPIGDAERLRAALDRCDGLLLTGGDDVNPACYGEEKLPCCGELTPERDFAEPVLIRRAMERGIPILGICRGMQILNATLGGTRYQDIALQFSNALKHPCYDIPADDAHTMRLLPDTLLRRVMGTDQCMVNSRHHQAVKKLAPGLRASAQAPDGLIEGMEAADGRPILCVQWHPESIQRRLPEHLRLFRWLVTEAGK